MTAFPYTLTEDPRPCFGLVALQVDETIEDDFRRMFPLETARLHVTRVPSGAELTPETIAGMETDLPAAAGLLPAAVCFDAIAYGCTSGTTLIGAPRVQALIQSHARTTTVCNPLTAALAAIRALGLVRVGIVSPYIPSVAAPMRAAFQAGGLTVPDMLGFGECIESRVARISEASLRAATLELARRNTLDAVFLSCTNLRTLRLIPELEALLGVPVLSSNQVLGWHMAQLAGHGPVAIPGRLASARLP